jgi:ribonuclease J
MNCLALEQRGEVILVDCGVTFDHRGLGVDVVHPDFSALDEYRDRIAGIVVTHGHEDHIGAIPYLLRRFDVPVWGPKYALGLLKERAREHEVLQSTRLIETTPGARYAVGSFVVEPIRVTHSIADATALAIETDGGVVVHTGDFKIDDEPPDGEEFDIARFTALGDAGVSLLFSDSTNIDAEGATGSEASVGKALEAIVRGAKGLVAVALFASNVHRLRLLGEIAKRTNRRIVPLGRSIQTHARVARSTGYLDWPSDLVWPAERLRELPRERVLALATGSQAEPRGALARLARGDFPGVSLGEGDTVVLSSRVIPGNEREVMAVMGNLLRRGVDLRSWYSDRGVHVSGHAHRVDQRRMIEMVRPRSFVPVHGTLHHLTRHGALARETGVRDVCVLENGDVATLGAKAITKSSNVPSGRVHVWDGREVEPSVLHERTQLAAEGVAVVVVPVDARGVIAGDVALSTLGVVDEAHARKLLDDARGEIRLAVAELAPSMRDDASVALAARRAVRRTFDRALGFKPNVVVTVRRAP